MSGAELVGIISAVISIVDATIKVYNAAKDDAGLPPNFKTVSTKFPLVSMLLKDAERYINDKADSTITATFTPVLTHCKEKATELQQVFEKVIPTEGDARIERYFKAARAIGKGGRVETLMEGILHDLQLLTAKLPVAISARGQASLTEAIEEVKELDPSLPDGFEDAPSFAHSGTGAQNANTGLADRGENLVAHFFSNAGACATRSQCNEFASNTFGGPTKPVPMQGLFSYSVITANDSVIVQFRDPASPLDVGMVNAAHRIHSEVVAGCSYLGTLGTSPGLPIYSMKMLPGDNYLSISLSESSEDLAFQLATIRSLARFFAQSWQYNADSYVSSNILEECRSSFDNLITTLPSCLEKTAAWVQQRLPSLFSGKFPLVITHGDLSEMNILADARTGEITGVVDWAEAGIRPFGFSLYALDNLLGYMTPTGWVFHDAATHLRDEFWKAFDELVGGVSDSEMELIQLARLVGLFLRYGRPYAAGHKGVVGVGGASNSSIEFLRALVSG